MRPRNPVSGARDRHGRLDRRYELRTAAGRDGSADASRSYACRPSRTSDSPTCASGPEDEGSESRELVRRSRRFRARRSRVDRRATSRARRGRTGARQPTLLRASVSLSMLNGVATPQLRRGSTRRRDDERRQRFGRGTQSGLSRAQLIRRAGVLGAAAAIPGDRGSRRCERGHRRTPPPEVGGTSALKALTAAEATTLEAVLERLCPADAAGPGAKEANVLRYIDWSLAGDLSAVPVRRTRAALAALDAYSRRRPTGPPSRRSRRCSRTLLSPAWRRDREAAGRDGAVHRLLAELGGGLHDDPHPRAAGHVRRPDARRQRGPRRLEARALPGAAADRLEGAISRSTRRPRRT